jgi:hypothetical protein
MAVGLAEAGANMVAMSRRQGQADEVAAKIEAVGCNSITGEILVVDGGSLASGVNQ